MKRVVAIVAIACTGLPLACGKSGGKDDDLRITADDRRPPKPRDPKDKSAPEEPALASPVIILDDKQLTIDGKRIDLLPHLPDLVAIFGKAERTDPTGNVIHIYEKAGLVLYEEPSGSGGTGRIIELSVMVGQEPGFPFMPKKTFAGTLVVQGMKIDATTTLESIKKKLTMFTWESGLGHDVDAYISKHQTFFIAPDGKDEVAQVAISFPHDPPPPP
jgi:hypothetical protein